MHSKEGNKVSLKSPHMREKLLENLMILADVEYQNQVWFEQEFPPSIDNDCWDDFGVRLIYFEFAFDFVYDETSLVENPEGAIGIFFKDEREVELIKAVLRAIEGVFVTVGIDATDQEYISCPEWKDVLEAASKALQVMNSDRERPTDGIKSIGILPLN